MLRPISLSRRTLTSSIFFATFFGSVLTVAASTLLPCPARNGKSKPLTSSELLQDDVRGEEKMEGERIRFAGRKGWIQVEEKGRRGG